MAKKYVEGMGIAYKKLLKTLGWLIPIAALIVAVLFLIKGRPNPTFSRKPETVMPEYIKTILPFLPPSAQLPTQQDFTQLLSFFVDKDQTWARNHLDALAWLGMGANDNAYRQADDQKKMQAAYKFIIMQGPTQALTIQKTIESENKSHVTLQAASVRGRYEIELAPSGAGWQIIGFWGIPTKYASQLSQFQTRFGK